MNFIDRLLTIVITATVTSMIWIVAGGSLMEMASSDSQIQSTRPAAAAPSPQASLARKPSATEAAPSVASDAPSLDIDESSQPTAGESANLLIPVLNVRASDLTDTFSNTTDGGVRLHEALDIMAPVGTTVVTAAPGTIEKLYQSSAGGKTVYVRSADGRTIHYYAHMAEYADGLREGQRVRRGQRLGTVGSTGNASDEAPHLHFAILRTTEDAEWWEPANAINPYPLLAGE
ncbi:M23 family metallopeptidase [Parerythrobacter aestuarii]|uniref:M23 family metallopeptidase n=1 Tax=Parerythrobacter aestuarii TaxID=3020909 RepID=UPI0024DEB187|nr:M23 family metallopeptidase [Parerythrobacter aestuarii]